MKLSVEYFFDKFLKLLSKAKAKKFLLGTSALAITLVLLLGNLFFSTSMPVYKNSKSGDRLLPIYSVARSDGKVAISLMPPGAQSEQRNC